MCWYQWFPSKYFFLLLLYNLVVEIGYAQDCYLQDVVSIDIELAPVLSEAQILGLTALGLDSKGSGPQIISGTLKNETEKTLYNLFLEIKIEASTLGVLGRVEQQAQYPFSLAPMQVVFGTNNDIINEKIPGIVESLRFNAEITEVGEKFIENLGGLTELPNDVYTIYTSVSQVTDKCGRTILAEEITSVGGGVENIVVDELSVLLKAPGSEVGSNFAISNPYPQFSWDGNPNIEYRIIVVSDENDQDVQTMINDAKGSSADGQLIIPYEYLDKTVKGINLQYPTVNAKPLEQGKRYYWQVSTELNSISGTEEYVSDIWTFTLINSSDSTNVQILEIDEKSTQAIYALIGSDLFEMLLEQGFNFEGLEIDDQIYIGQNALVKLSDLLDSINNGEIFVKDD